MIECPSQQEDEERQDLEDSSSTFAFGFPSGEKIDQASRVRHLNIQKEQSQSPQKTNKVNKPQKNVKIKCSSNNSQATNESFSSIESASAPYDQFTHKRQSSRQYSDRGQEIKQNQQFLTANHSKKTSDTASFRPKENLLKSNSNSSDNIYNKVAIILPFREEEPVAELVEYQCQSSDDDGLE